MSEFMAVDWTLRASNRNADTDFFLIKIWAWYRNTLQLPHCISLRDVDVGSRDGCVSQERVSRSAHGKSST